MKLGDYLESQQLTRAEFAQRIGVTTEAVRRYEDCGRVPTPKVMARILSATNGEVTANDFYRVAA